MFCHLNAFPRGGCLSVCLNAIDKMTTPSPAMAQERAADQPAQRTGDSAAEGGGETAAEKRTESAAARAKAVLAASAAAREKVIRSGSASHSLGLSRARSLTRPRTLSAQSSLGTVRVTGARAVQTTGVERKQRLRNKGKKEGCTIGIDRDRRIVCRSGAKEFRIPRALLPVVLVVFLLLLFIRSGTKEEHVAAAEQLHSYSGSLDGAALTVLASTVSTLSGVAPGALFVPIFIAVEGLNPHDAIPLALATTLGGAVAVAVRDWTKAHPLHPERRLIDTHAVALLAPPVAAGSIMGVYADKILPPWVLTLLLTATLLFFTAKAAREGRDALAPVDPLAPPAASAPSLDLEAAAAAGNVGGSVRPSTTDESGSRKALAVVSGVLLGGAVLQALAPCGGTVFWAALASMLFVLAGVGGWHAQAAIATHTTRVATNYVYVVGDIQWDETTTVDAAVKAVGGGIATGLLGLGTGPTTIPTASLLGLLPVVSAPTTAFITAVASLGGCCQYLQLGLLSPWLTIWQVLLGFTGVVPSQYNAYCLCVCVCVCV